MLRLAGSAREQTITFMYRDDLPSVLQGNKAKRIYELRYNLSLHRDLVNCDANLSRNWSANEGPKRVFVLSGWSIDFSDFDCYYQPSA
jgi:hemolysin activation/secretion protein